MLCQLKLKGKCQKYLPLRRPLTLIIGPINVEVLVNGLENPINHVEFYLDNNLKLNDTTSPFIWQWNSLSFWKHTLTVKAYSENRIELSTQQVVWKFL